MSLEAARKLAAVSARFCFNPYFVGDESGSSGSSVDFITLSFVSILILLEMSLEEVKLSIKEHIPK